MTLEGFVLQPDGTPSEGVVVVSSEGGKAVTDAAGRYRLEVRVPLGTECVNVTAVEGGAGRLASASVALRATGTTRVDPLVLALGSSCSPRWLPTFGGQPGTNNAIRALAVFDDGGGPALYVGGGFTSAGGVPANRIAKWDGSSWSPLGSGLNNAVLTLGTFDDGSGPSLYAGGTFRTAGGVAANFIAKWNGSSWSALGSGMDDSVDALVVHDDGSGQALYAGGHFNNASGVVANGIARWDGSSWSVLNSGMSNNSTVLALTVYNDSGGPTLYAGGFLPTLGGGTNHLAKWDGSSWSTIAGAPYFTRTLAVHDDGGGPALYVGGAALASSDSAIARWNGSAWSAVGSGLTSPGGAEVLALSVFDDGGGPALYASGVFFGVGAPYDHIAKWDGSNWSPVHPGIVSTELTPVLALATFDDGSGSALFAGGTFTISGSAGVSRIAKWNGASWSGLGGGLNDVVLDLAVYDDGGGPALYACGRFTGAGGSVHGRVARWNGSVWSTLGSGVNGEVLAMTVHDDGSGPALFVAGSFGTAGGIVAPGIAKWDGSSWSPLGSGLAYAPGLALETLDDGSGPALYVGGRFWLAGGVPAEKIARWDGSSWSALGSGLGGRGGGVDSFVDALEVHDDGSGPALYVGGHFERAGALQLNDVAKWDGANWSSLGSGMDGGAFAPVRALLSHDDGSGAALFAGGDFFFAGGTTAVGIAKWDGTSWSALNPSILARISALITHADGSGPALYASGTFTLPGGSTLSAIGRWDGSHWASLGTGGGNGTLEVYDDGNGPALFAGGSSIDSGDSFLSKWGRPADLEAPILTCPASVVVVGNPSGEVVSYVVTADDCHDPAPSLVCVPPSGSHFPSGTTLVTCTATDAAGNQSTCQFPVTVVLKARRR